MNIRVFDVVIRTGNGITVPQFLGSLLEDSGAVHKWRELNRQMHLHPYDDDFHCGVFLTQFENRFQVVLEGNKLRAAALKGKQKSASVNLILIHNKTGRGIYTHYSGSTSYSAFNSYMKFRYEPFRQSIESEAKSRERESLRASGKKVSEKSLNNISKRYRGTASVSRVIRNDALAVLIDELAELDEFEFPIDETTVSNKAYNPLFRVTRNKKAVFRLDSNLSKKELKSGILEAVTGAKLTRGTVRGKTPNGDYRSLHIEKARNKSVLEIWDYDDIIDGIEIDFADLKSCDLFQEMRKLAKPIDKYRAP